MTNNTTPNYHLTIPKRGTRNWETPINENFMMLDEIIKENSLDHDSIRAQIEEEAARLEQEIDGVDTKLSQIVIESGSSNPEIVDARYSELNDIMYEKIGKRLNAIEQEIKNNTLSNTSNTNSLSALSEIVEKNTSMIESHVENEDNPHNITPEQINAPDLDMFNYLMKSVEETKADNIFTMLFVQTNLQSQIHGISSNIILVDAASSADDFKINVGKYDDEEKHIYIP